MSSRGVLVSSKVTAGDSRGTASAASSFLTRFAARHQAPSSASAGAPNAAPAPAPPRSSSMPAQLSVSTPRSPATAQVTSARSSAALAARASPRSAQSHSPGFEMPPSGRGAASERSSRASTSRRSRGTNRAWTMSDEIAEYEERVRAARAELQILQDTHTQLTEKLVSANTLNETLEQRLEQAQHEAGNAKRDHDHTVADLQDVETQIRNLNEELATLRPKAEDAATRLGEARSKLQSDEATLKSELAAAEAAAKRREHDLTVRIKQQQEALQATRLEADELANVSMTHQQLKQEATRLKQQLVHAKAYTLHKSLAQTIRDSREQTERLRKIIEHVKQEKHTIDEELRQARLERDTVKQKLSELVFGASDVAAGHDTIAMPMALTAAISLSPGAAAGANGGASVPTPTRRAPGPLTAAAVAAVTGNALAPANGSTDGPASSASAADAASAAHTNGGVDSGAGASGGAGAGAPSGSGAAAGAAAPAPSASSLPSLRDLLAASGPGGYTELNRKLDEQQAQRLQEMSHELESDDGGDASQVTAWMGEVRTELLRLRREAVVHTQEDSEATSEATPGAK